MPRSPDPWRCIECGEGGRRRSGDAVAHDRCADSAAFREDVLQLVERFPDVPLEQIGAALGVTAADIDRFVASARSRRARIGERRP